MIHSYIKSVQYLNIWNKDRRSRLDRDRQFAILYLKWLTFNIIKLNYDKCSIKIYFLIKKI